MKQRGFEEVSGQILIQQILVRKLINYPAEREIVDALKRAGAPIKLPDLSWSFTSDTGYVL